MSIPHQFYEEQLQNHNATFKVISKKLLASSVVRFLLFAAVCFLVYWTFGQAKIVLPIIFTGVVLFVFLVTRHSNLQYQRELLRAKIALCKTELTVLERNFHQLPDGNEYKDPTHYYSQDIDLFGRGSFFQYINRTALQSGSDELGAILKENSIEDIPKKQEAIKELRDIPKWRIHFSGIATLVKTEASAEYIVKWMKEYESFVPKFMKPLSWVFSIISVFGLIGYFMDLVPGFFVSIWFFIGLTITGKYFKKINQLAIHTAKIQSTFQQFYKLLKEIEKQEFSTALLQEKQQIVMSEAKITSDVLQGFAKHLDGLDQRNNMLVGVIRSGFMIYDLKIVRDIESWIESHKSSVDKWFEVISFFDAYSSLGNYAFNHPSYVFPEIVKEKSVLNSTGAGHPLLNEKVSVLNDFKINSEQFFIITGANMAGKSTFLRTIALQIVMSNIGLPVCSKTVQYTPIKLITSMRTTDSLTDDESYFFSELKRLKYIVDEMKNDNYFIILDEILKGTNSKDKAIGSRDFINKLVQSHSTGVIATHDLSLCKAADEMPEVENYYFDATIENNELYFDYTFKPGICQNMNASFLLRKMGIVD